MLLLITLLAQVALAFCCLCQERCEYYTSYTSTQPAYDYPEYQYNPYSPTGYSYNYGSYSQPSYETSTGVSAIVYPYPVSAFYESYKEEPSCGCGRKHTESSPCSENRYRYEDEREYTSSRCTCAGTERDRTERRYQEDRDSKPSCGCRHSKEYRRDSDKYHDRDYEEYGRSKVKCICICDEYNGDFRDDDGCERGSSRREDQRCRHRENNRDCCCGRKNEQY